MVIIAGSVDKIGNFEISGDNETVIVSYTRTKKDWFDILVVSLIAAVLIVATFFIIRYALQEPSFISIVISVLFITGTFFKLVDGLSRILAATKSLVTINHTAGTLTAKNNVFTSKTVAIDSIKNLSIEGQKESLRFTTGTSATRFFCQIKIELNDGTALVLLTINPDTFIKLPDQKTETDLYLQSRKLATLLGTYLNLKYRWKGFKES